MVGECGVGGWSGEIEYNALTLALSRYAGEGTRHADALPRADSAPFPRPRAFAEGFGAAGKGRGINGINHMFVRRSDRFGTMRGRFVTLSEAFDACEGGSAGRRLAGLRQRVRHLGRAAGLGDRRRASAWHCRRRAR
jgi:hypothetical protein